jgi:hypothetical protein
VSDELPEVFKVAASLSRNWADEELTARGRPTPDSNPAQISHLSGGSDSRLRKSEQKLEEGSQYDYQSQQEGQLTEIK